MFLFLANSLITLHDWTAGMNSLDQKKSAAWFESKFEVKIHLGLDLV